MDYPDLIALIGISGTGKTTLGKALAARLKYTYIDLDSFYKKEKPRTRLSDGKFVSNWDTLKALDLDALREKLKKTPGGIILGGFVLKDKIFEKLPRMTILLAPVSKNEIRGTSKDQLLATFSRGDLKEQIIKRTIASRQAAKGVSSKDALVVREIVYPYFLKTLTKTKIDRVLPVYDEQVEGKPVRLPVENLVSNLADMIEEY